MSYPIIPQQLNKSQREAINSEILQHIKAGRRSISNETIYNSYSGLGGLHGLKQDDFDNYHQYSEAKKEFELGQFFTPHEICKQMVDLVNPSPEDTVLDMCCGMGNFFNHLPNHHNAFGFDVDSDAIKVAKKLYPDANLEVMDIRQYNPERSFDYVIGNPPFNLEFEETKSQNYYCNKAYWVLNPGGIMILIVPSSYLQNEFWDASQIRRIDQDFSFVGQSKLDPNAFGSLGVKNYGTKIMVFTRKSEYIVQNPYQADEFLSLSDLKIKIDQAKELKAQQRIRILRECSKEYRQAEDDFHYTINKYLYELKTHKHLHKHYKKSLALLAKLRTQKPPADCSNEAFKAWEKRKLTQPQVLSIIRKHIRKKKNADCKEVKLVRCQYGYRLNAKPSQTRDKDAKRYVPFYELVAYNAPLPYPKTMTAELREQYAKAEKVLQKKQREFQLQSQKFSDMERDPELDKYIESLTFVNKKKEVCKFVDLQKHDMGLAFQKRYPLLNWQQGSGKTAAAFHYAKYQLDQKRVKNVVILAPANATEMTWDDFLKLNNVPYIRVKKEKDLVNIPEGIFVLIPLSILHKLEKRIKQYMKMVSNKICLLFDESDEITNPKSKRTKSTLSLFRRSKYTIPATGTTTRNNINELYSQLELMYNNSVNMMCDCFHSYYEDDDNIIRERLNDYYRKPFPARGGDTLFKSCFCPGKATVFGIEQHNQDIYNQEVLFALISKSIITRKFKEFAGDKYTIYTHNVMTHEGEREVYRIILEEFHEICDQYFKSTGDSKKDAQLKLIRQIQLLIKSCSVPNQMEGYTGDQYPSKARKIQKMVKRMKDKVAIGCTTLDSLHMYNYFITEEFPHRQTFLIHGGIPFKSRQKILDKFEATTDGILICTQQSLKSSINIPSCNNVIMEALQWNIPKMEQFYFRFIRLDSEDHTDVHFLNYVGSIEQNLMALVLTKENLNEFIKTGEVKDQADIYEEFDISPSLLDGVMKREQDKDGKFHISWGAQKIS